MTFDLISQEYGWADEQILNLSFARLRQIRDVILSRRRAQLEDTLRVQEVMVRELLVAIYGQAGADEGVKYATRWSLLKKEPEVPTLQQVSRSFPVDEAAGGLITPEMIAARRAELGLD